MDVDVRKYVGEKRHWQPREMLMLTEFLTKYYSDARWLTRVRLGQPKPDIPVEGLTEEEKRALMPWSRWADAIILLPDRTIIVEAAIRANPGKIAQILLYKELFYKTEEFRDRWDKPVELMIVYAIEDPVLIKMAREQGIKCVEYKPIWLEDYLKLLKPSERRAPKPPP